MRELPKPIIKTRIQNKKLYNAAIEAGATHIQALIISNRNIPDGTDIYGFMNPSLDNIPNIGKLQDIHKAGSRIADAIINREVICLACDFDVDGTSSAAVMQKAIVDLFQMPSYLVKTCISNRMKEGYGFNKDVVKRILDNYDPLPSLIITADQGSSNGAEVTAYIEETRKIMTKRGSAKKIDRVADVIVSDHHEIPKSGGPKDAYAFVNPQRLDDEYPDKTICGCTVAMFLMASTRAALIKKGYLTKDAPTIKPLMAYATAATVADCVSMASQTNRAIIRQGLEEINNETIPAWKAMKALIIRDPSQPVVSDSIGFGLGPMINACSRTGGDGLNAVKFYLAETDQEAQRYLSMLKVDNDLRKDIEKRLLEEAIEKTFDLIDKNYKSLVIPIKNGHHGIHGIVASRIVERFGRPTILLSPKVTTKEIVDKKEAERLIGQTINLNKLEDFYDIPKSYSFITPKKEGTGKNRKTVFYKETITVMSGSGRSIDGLGKDQKGQLNLLRCMIDAHEKENVFLGFGGHHMAAGMGLEVSKINALRKGIEEAVSNYVDESELHPKFFTDGKLPDGYDIDENLVNEIMALEPYGRQFDYPSFIIEASIEEFKLVGKEETKETGSFIINYNGTKYRGVAFKFDRDPMCQELLEGTQGKRYKIMFEPRFNYFRGEKSVQLQIKKCEEI